MSPLIPNLGRTGAWGACEGASTISYEVKGDEGKHTELRVRRKTLVVFFGEPIRLGMRPRVHMRWTTRVGWNPRLVRALSPRARRVHTEPFDDRVLSEIDDTNAARVGSASTELRRRDSIARRVLCAGGTRPATLKNAELENPVKNRKMRKTAKPYIRVMNESTRVATYRYLGQTRPGN